MNVLSKAVLSALGALVVSGPVRADEVALVVGGIGSIERLVQAGLLMPIESGWYQVDGKRLSELLEGVNRRKVEAIELLQTLQQIVGDGAQITGVELAHIPVATQDRKL